MVPILKKYISRIGLFLLIASTAGVVLTAQASETRTHILQVADPVKSGKYVRSRFLKRMKKPFSSKDRRKKMLIMGDSHAQDFYNALSENNINKRFQVSTRRIPAICGLYLGKENISRLIHRKHVANCKKADTLKAALPQIKQADVVIIAANWKLWSVKRLKTTVKNLRIKRPQKLFVVGRKNFGKLNMRKYLRMTDKQLSKLRNPVLGAQREINRIMKSGLSKSVFVDIQGLICKSEKDCPLFTPQPRLISFDGGHLTPQGASYVGRILLKSRPLNQL